MDQTVQTAWESYLVNLSVLLVRPVLLSSHSTIRTVLNACFRECFWFIQYLVRCGHFVPHHVYIKLCTGVIGQDMDCLASSESVFPVLLQTLCLSIKTRPSKPDLIFFFDWPVLLASPVVKPKLNHEATFWQPFDSLVFRVCHNILSASASSYQLVVYLYNPRRVRSRQRSVLVPQTPFRVL